jgi:AP2 domain.
MARLKLQGGEIAYIDKKDIELVTSTSLYWYVKPVHSDHHHHIPTCHDSNHKHVYVVANLEDQSVIYLHHLITGFKNAVYIDFNGLNNRRSNLEPSGAAQMAMSSPKKKFKKPPTSKYKGVSWNKNMAKWTAQIYHNYALIKLGAFLDEKEAAKAYDKAARELFGKYARPNFVEKGD